MAVAPHVIGTAGHIDHGKTSLVRALTGIDTDRLKEEKERGITIELGFAHLALPRSGVVGVVDVPGHERFVRTMVAGAVGIDLVVLVVAADEGVMPQTREHLDICGLLGVARGLVALTKSDAVDRDMLELATLDVREGLRGSFLAEAPIVPCSAHTGAGLAELRAALDEALMTLGPRPGREAQALCRLPVDRVFTVKGFGTVATGTLWSGRLQVGEELEVQPGGGLAKIRGLQVHGQAVAAAEAGQRVAVNLNLPREALLRGETLVQPGTLQAGALLDVRVHHLGNGRGPLRRRARVLFHAGTTQRLAQLTLLDRGELPPGEAGLAQVQLDQPLLLVPGDRFILRGFAVQKNHGTTLGGGEVLRVHSARQRRGTPGLIARLGAVEAGLLGAMAGERAAEEELLAQAVARAGVGGLTLLALCGQAPLPRRRVQAAVERLLNARRIISLTGAGAGEEPRYASREALELAQQAVLDAVARHHEAEPLAVGLGREALRAAIGPRGGERGGREEAGEGRPQLLHPRLLVRALELLAKEGRLVQKPEVVHLPGHDPHAAQRERGLLPLQERLLACYREAGLAPPRLAEAAEALRVMPEALRGPLELLCRTGGLVRVKDLLFEQGALAALRERLVVFLRAEKTINPTQWKDLVGQSRKYTIPLAEHFDAEKLTLRVGDLRKLRG